MITPSQGAGRNTPPRTITTVIANLNKAYGGSHIGRLSDMTSVKQFVARTLELTPFNPDVVLLSEVRSHPTRVAAKSFTAKTGDTYKVVALPGRRPTTDFAHKQIHKDTGIILNMTTMKPVAPGAYMTHKYKRAQAARGTKLSYRKTAYVGAVQRSSGGTYAFASIHYTTPDQLRTKSVSDALREKWSKQIAAKLDVKFPSSVMDEIGGDFNMVRCFSGAFKSCKEARFWSYLSSHGFVDSLYVLPMKTPGPANCNEGMTGVDYVFTTGSPINGGADAKGGYSDHKLRWVVNQASPFRPC
jgi:hypothetical protein